MVVRVEPRSGTINGRIEWRYATSQWAGDQTFPSVSIDCPRLVRSMGFALAVHIQLMARMTAASEVSAVALAETESPAESPPSATTATPPVATPPPSPAPTVTSTATVERSAAGAPSPAGRPGLAVGTGPAVGFGMASEPVLLARLFGVVGWQHVSLELLAAVASLPTTTRRPDGAGFSQQHLLGQRRGLRNGRTMERMRPRDCGHGSHVRRPHLSAAPRRRACRSSKLEFGPLCARASGAAPS